MQTKITLLFVAVCMATSLSARPVSKTEALNIAQQFVQNKLAVTRLANNFSLAFTASDKSMTRSTTTTRNYFYVYNIGEKNGFVIVSADTRVKKILGYSDKGTFSPDNMPSNLKAWLNFYTDEIGYAIDNLPESQSEVTETLFRNARQINAVSPLLGNIIYDQGAPYYNLCPLDGTSHTYTGCVATAMAQVMRYHQHPSQGSGSKTYTTQTLGKTLTVDFGATTYDWANTLPYYYSSASQQENDAVATLMYHAGVSVNMDYTTSGSGTMTNFAVNAMHTYFGYDAGIQFYDRKYFLEDEWIAKVKAEIDASRPVIYQGANSTNEGHAFVCDGYDDNNLFHINWGWSGISNGYYELSALTPDIQGIGGSNGGYNYYQGIVAGIQKPVAGSIKKQVLGLDSLSVSANSIQRNGSVDITLYNLANPAGFDYISGAVGFALSQDGQADIPLTGARIDTLKINMYYPAATLSGISFGSEIANGIYQLKVIYQDEQINYPQIMTSTKGFSYLNVEITNSKITFSKPTIQSTLQLSVDPLATVTLYQNKTGAFDVSVSNIGTVEYNAQIGLRLVKTDNPAVTQDVVSNIELIPVSETKILHMNGKITVAPGDYNVEIYYDATNNSSNTTFPTTLFTQSAPITRLTKDISATTVTVNAEPAAPNLSVTSMDMPSPIARGESFSLPVSIQNNGGFHDGELKAIVTDPSNGNSFVILFGNQTPLIDGGTTENLSFDGLFSGIPEGTYNVSIYDGNTLLANSTQSFDIQDIAVGVNTKQENSLKVLNNPIKETLEMRVPADIIAIYLYNVQGKTIKVIDARKNSFISLPVSQLPKGIYILKAEDKFGKQFIEKIVKQ